MNTDLEAQIKQHQSTNPWLCITLLWAEINRLRALLAAKEAERHG